MEQAILVAKVFGPFMFLISLWILTRKDSCIGLCRVMVKDPVMLYFSAIFNLLFGLTILALYSTWSLHLAVLVTLLGWLMLIKGVLLLFYPKYVDLFQIDTMSMQKATMTMQIGAAIWFLYGIALCVLGFSS